MIGPMKRDATQDVTRFADMLAAMGAEPRLRIVRLLLESHPEGLIAGPARPPAP
jgi:hypothetical protein